MNRVRQRALNFNGQSYATIKPAPVRPNASAITLEAWIYLREGGVENQGIIGSSNLSYLLYRQGSSNQIRLYINNGSVSNDVGAKTTLANNVWYHVVAVYDKSLSKEYNVYVNGDTNNQQTGAL